MCFYEIRDQSIADSILPIITQCELRKNETVDIDWVIEDSYSQLQQEVKAQKNSGNDQLPAIMITSTHQDSTEEEGDRLQSEGGNQTALYYKKLENFFYNLTGKLVIYDPLERKLPNDEGENQATSREDLLELIQKLNPTPS